MSELLKRILFAIPAGAGFVAITWLGGYYLTILLLVLLLVGQYEIVQLTRKADQEVNPLFVYLLGVWIFLMFAIAQWIWAGMLLIGILITVEIFLAENREIGRLSNTLFWGSYGPLGFGAFLFVRQVGSNEEGFALALAFLLMIWFNDILAYLGGKYFGKHAMAPDISPNKTWEGFAFGIAGSIIGLITVVGITGNWFPLSYSLALPMALIAGITGPIGDLTQSRLKRVAGAKDASDIFPGHGGVWDRFDAMILTTITLIAYLQMLKQWSVVGF